MCFKRLFSLALLVTLFSSCGQNGNKRKSQNEEDKQDARIKIDQLWTCDTLLLTPESVIYDVERDLLYVSNVNTGPWEKNGDGFISILSLDGDMINSRWVEGFNSPKGMGIVDSILYVADIDRVVKVDIKKGKVIGDILFEDEDGLNDIAIGDNGGVFVSSSSKSRLYRIYNNSPEIVVSGDDVRFNGVYAEGENIYIITSKTGQLLNYNLDTNKLDTLVNGLGQGDGLKYLGSNEFLTSDWQGEVFYVGKDRTVQSILRTKENKINTADIEFIKEKNILLIPTFFDNKVIAYSFSKE